MGSLMVRPANDAPIEDINVRVGSAVIYTFFPGVPQEIPPEHYAAVRAQLQQLQGNMTSPAAPTVTPQGAAGAATYGYQVVAIGSGGDSMPSPTGQTTTGNAALSGANYNAISWPAVPHANGYRILRTVGGGSTGLIGTVPPGTTSFNDTGLAASAFAAATSQPPAALVVAGPADE